MSKKPASVDVDERWIGRWRMRLQVLEKTGKREK